MASAGSALGATRPFKSIRPLGISGFVGLLAIFVMSGLPATAGSPSAGLISTLETAPAVIVGTVSSVSPLKHAAYLARVDVERDLRPGAVDDDASTAPDEVVVVWEEPAPSLPARFEAGHFVLLALEPMPTASIWKARLPDAALRGRALAIAESGNAFLRRPSSFDLTTLDHYLALSGDAREGDAGSIRLADLTAGGSPDLARAAWSRLETILAGRSRPVPPRAATALVTALARTDAGDLPDRIVAWIDRARPQELRPPLDARLAAEDDDSKPVPWLSAAAALDGELAPTSTMDLAASPDEARRLLAARRAGGDVAPKILPGLIRDDPSPAVRAAALARWVALRGELAMPETLRALEDPVASVRMQAAESMAGFGSPAIYPLVDETHRGTPDSARIAIVALSMMGEEARIELVTIAETHEDEAMRTLARVALGLPIGDIH